MRTFNSIDSVYFVYSLSNKTRAVYIVCQSGLFMFYAFNGSVLLIIKNS